MPGLTIFILLVTFLLMLGYSLNMTWLALPILIFIQFTVILAIGSVLAAIVPFFPDLKFIIDNAMLLLFFLSGIFFDFSSVAPEVKSYLNINPMLGIIEAYRTVLVAGNWPDWSLLGYVFIASLVFLALAWYLLDRYDRVYPKII